MPKIEIEKVCNGYIIRLEGGHGRRYKEKTEVFESLTGLLERVQDFFTREAVELETLTDDKIKIFEDDNT